MPRMDSIEHAAVIFPTFPNLEYIYHVFTFLQTFTRICIEIEFYVAIIGIFLTMFHIFILTRKAMKMSSIISIMIGIAVCDLASMILALSVKDMISSFYRDDCTPPMELLTYRIFWVLMTLRDNVIRCSTWLGILMALIRFISSRFRLRTGFKRFSNFSFGFYATGFIFVLSSLLSLLNYMRTKIVEAGVWTPDANCTAKHNRTWILHELRASDLYAANNGFLLRIAMLINGSVSRIIPCLLLPLLTLLLIIEIRRVRKKVSNINIAVRLRTERTTSLVMIMAVTFFIASLPAGIFTLFQVMYTDVGFFHLSTFVDHFSNAILTVMASFHCFICFAMSSEYRRTTLEILRIRKKNFYSNSIF